MTALGGTSRPAPQPSEPSAYPDLLDHVLDGKHYRPLLDSPEVERHRRDWRRLFADLIACPPRDTDISARFHEQWHVSHFNIRELVDDDDLVMDALWKWLPRYDGPAMLLYRGENIDRLDAGRIGTAWSNKEETAEMFARGWNAVGGGGVVLRTMAPAEAIIARPSAHSLYLGEAEFTVDWRKLGPIEKTRIFPSQ